jgi:hypothetical protein
MTSLGTGQGRPKIVQACPGAAPGPAHHHGRPASRNPLQYLGNGRPPECQEYSRGKTKRFLQVDSLDIYARVVWKRDEECGL